MTNIDPDTEITNVVFTLQDLVNEFKIPIEYADEISNEFAGRLEDMLIEYGWDMLRVIMQDYAQNNDPCETCGSTKECKVCGSCDACDTHDGICR